MKVFGHCVDSSPVLNILELSPFVSFPHRTFIAVFWMLANTHLHVILFSLQGRPQGVSSRSQSDGSLCVWEGIAGEVCQRYCSGIAGAAWTQLYSQVSTHSMTITHRIKAFCCLLFRDIAARTCLLSSDLTAKIGDCGAAETLYKVTKTTIILRFKIKSNKYMYMFHCRMITTWTSNAFQSLFAGYRKKLSEL